MLLCLAFKIKLKEGRKVISASSKDELNGNINTERKYSFVFVIIKSNDV